MSTARRGTLVRLSSAILTLLNNVSAPYWSESGDDGWVMPVIFSRGALPVFSKDEISVAQVVVVPGGTDGTEGDRGHTEYFDLTIGIGVGKNVGINAEGRAEEVDKLTTLVEQLQEFLTWPSQRVIEMPAVMDGATLVQDSHNAGLTFPFTNTPLFDSTMLRTEGLFLSVTNFVYHFERMKS